MRFHCYFDGAPERVKIYFVEALHGIGLLRTHLHCVAECSATICDLSCPSSARATLFISRRRDTHESRAADYLLHRLVNMRTSKRGAHVLLPISISRIFLASTSRVKRNGTTSSAFVPHKRVCFGVCDAATLHSLRLADRPQKTLTEKRPSQNVLCVELEGRSCTATAAKGRP